MPFNRPALQEMLDQIQSEMDIAFNSGNARLDQSVENVLSRVYAMAQHEMYGYLAYMIKQILPDSAEQDFLERHASIWDVDRKQATKSTGTITFTGTNGTIIPEGTILKRADGQLYRTTQNATLSSGAASIEIESLNTGQSLNAVSGLALVMSSPIAGVQSQAIVAVSGITGGTDREDDNSLRSRIISRIQQPPHGGASFDYETWAKNVAGVTRAWVYPEQLGLGTVQVIFVMDNKDSTIIPNLVEVQAVQDYIDTQRPVTADVTVTAPVALPIDFEIALNPNTPAIQSAVRAELEDFFRRESAPAGTLYLSRISEAISAANGEFYHVLNTPNTNITASFGQMPILGTITWSSL